MDWFLTVSKIGSALFVLLQLLIIIDFAFDLQQYLLGKIERYEQQCVREGREAPGIAHDGWKQLYIALIVILFAACLGGIIAMWVTLPPCGTTNGFLSVTLIAGVLLSVASITISYPEGVIAPNPGAIPPMVLWANNVWLAWGALTNNPDTQCNPYLSVDNSSLGNIIISLLLVGISITWSTLRTAHSSSSSAQLGGTRTLETTEKEAEEEEPHPASAVAEREALPTGTAAAVDKYDGLKAAEPSTGSVDAVAEADKGSWTFHLVMMLGSLYLAMLLSNWGTAQPSTTGVTAAPEASDASMWVRMAMQFVSWVLYGWILLAPMLMPGRFRAEA
jgi:serine incorporator 1/3